MTKKITDADLRRHGARMHVLDNTLVRTLKDQVSEYVETIDALKAAGRPTKKHEAALKKKRAALAEAKKGRYVK